MRRPTAIAAIIILIIIGVGIYLLAGNFSSSDNSQISEDKTTGILEKGKVDKGQPAPNFSLKSFTEEEVTLSSLKGKAVFIDFWAAWCPFCIEEMPEIEQISQEFSDQLVVLGIHRTETESTTRGAKFAAARGVTYPLLADDGSVYKTYTGGREFMPMAIFIDKSGNIVEILPGPKTVGQMQEAVKKALGEF